ncbi:MAG: NAD(+)/NADH kinase [Clostridiales bacterium]|nr:NAD(+)/NADH kinase [Clostridiales bacterium]
MVKKETRIINVFSNEDAYSKKTEDLLRQKLQKSGFYVPREFSPEAELIVSIGGDGSFLRTLHKYDFPDIPFLGINTGHLGFFEELYPDQLDQFIFMYKQGRYEIQNLKTVKAEVKDGDKIVEYKGLNEVVIIGDRTRTIHLNISIGESFIERFSGDGIVVSTPAGSTAYNYSLGGSIVDPRLSILQITPIAPMNTTAYRSFTSSVVLPQELYVRVNPEHQDSNTCMIVVDGMEHKHDDIKEIILEFSDTIVKLMRFENYDFWNKVKTKFL